MRIWGIPSVELFLPFLVSLTQLVSGEAMSFPIAQTEPAFDIFPKLISEYDVLKEVYSLETARNYTLSYANSFILGALVIAGGILLEIVIRAASYPKGSHGTSGDTEAKSMSRSGRSQVIKSLISGGALLLALLCFAFHIPISFVPSPGVGETRLLNSLYGAFIFAFPVLFTLIYFFVLAGLSSVFPNFSSSQRH